MFEANLKTGLALACSALIAFGPSPAWSQSYKHFPGEPQDQRTLRTLDRVEELYESGEYGRAFLIYEKELAPIGDKYAQYMVGYMHLAGLSVPKSRVRALAWYRLAAERGDPLIVQERDALLQTMSDAEIEQSNEIFVDLWQELGDRRLLLELIREDMKILSERTGSRLPGGDTRPLTVINVRSRSNGGDNFYKQVQERVELRLNYLETEVVISDIAAASDQHDIRTMEEDIRRKFSALRSP